MNTQTLAMRTSRRLFKWRQRQRDAKRKTLMIDTQLTEGTELFFKSMAKDYGDPHMSALLKEVWGPTPWMIDVLTRDREEEIRGWCRKTFGSESSPIHKCVGAWHGSSVTIYGRTWFGFKTKSMMEQFESVFP